MSVARPLSVTPPRGILYLALGIFAFTAMDAVAKGLVAHYPTVQVIWARYIVNLIAVVLILGPRLTAALKTRFPWLHLARGISQMGAIGFFFASLNYIGLAEATALAEVNPLLITLGAVLFLGEALTRPRLIGIAVALIGTLIITRPGMGVFSAAALLPLGCAVSFAANILLTRAVGSRESAAAAMVYSALLGTLFSSTLVPFHWTPVAMPDLPAFILLGALGMAAQWCVVRAYSMSEAAAIAPFGYLDILFATFFSIVAFDEYPDRFTMIGALVIALAGLYVWRKERTAPNMAV